MIYGRRLGKSELVRQSIEDRNDAIYYQAVESTTQDDIERAADARDDVRLFGQADLVAEK